MNSIVQDAEIFMVDSYLSNPEADFLFDLLNDVTKFQTHNLYFYNTETNNIKVNKSWRKSYWFGDYAQSVQSTDTVATNTITGEKISIPTDFVKPYPFPPEILTLKNRIEKEYNVEFNSCLVGKFDSPSNKIGFHSDASNSMGDDPYIGSVSFGKTRKFILKKQSKFCDVGTKPEKVTVDRSTKIYVNACIYIYFFDRFCYAKILSQSDKCLVKIL